jgi:eukaryotic-like serine/threonine-protein kinase
VLAFLGDVRRRQGHLDEAASLIDEALQTARAGALHTDNPLLAIMNTDRARVHLERGEPAAAEPLLREVLRVQRLAYPEGSWRIASTQSLLGAALLDQGRYAEAEPLLVEASRVLKDIPGPQGRETKPTQERLAKLARRRG